MRRRFGRGRPPIKKFISFEPQIQKVVPHPHTNEKIILTREELEAMRLIDYLGMSHEEAANKMRISRPTATRLVNSARKKITDAIINGKIIFIL
jgi:predicted DNA-binding protein (UPF0251 family)